MLTHLSLFSGIGGLDLAAEWAGFETVGQCEWADYPTKVLEKHWPDVPKWRDIHTLTKESFYDRTRRETVDIISGGFPCQPFSVAGKQKGKGDDRYLWPEMLHVVRELTPRWALGENVPGILRIAAADVVADLEREGYDVAVFDFEAAAVGAPHRRERITFVANRRARDVENTSSDRLEKQKYIQPGDDTKTSGDVANPEHGSGSVRWDGEFSAAEKAGGIRENHGSRAKADVPGKRWPAEPGMARVANGVPNRVDRIKCLGNAVVPQQFYPIFRAIAMVEEDAPC